jgi:hypothetical protein
MHGRQVDPATALIDFHNPVSSGNATRYTAVSGLNLEHLIGRWVRGCHALLYSVPIAPDEFQVAMSLPLPSDRDLRDRELTAGMQPAHGLIVSRLKRQMSIGQIDRIVAYAGKFEYLCFWTRFDSGEPCCAFGMRIYNWEDLGRTDGLPKRGCVGIYRTGTQVPASAALESPVETPGERWAGLDPFNSGLAIR